jgi:transposase-like protein
MSSNVTRWRSCGFRVSRIYDTTLGNWVNHDQVNRGEREGLSSAERLELSELRRENARLRMERELLKRAVAFWVTESNE